MFVCLLFIPLNAAFVAAQDSPSESESLLADLNEQVELLNDPSYRRRQLALWRLQRYPQQTVSIIREKIVRADHNTGSQLIDLLTVFATQSDIALSLEAMALLRDTANDIGAVGQLAKNSLSAIADLQEEQAIEILVQADAYVGQRNFKINAQVDQGIEMALHIDDRFTGDAVTIQWIRFLKSVETVYLEGEKIDRRHLEAVSELTQVRNIKLRHVNLQAADLQLLRGFDNLEHLGLNYVNVDDGVIDILVELPISESLRLYGTQVSPEGVAKLKQQLDGIDIYGGRGGFLGVATGRLNTVVTIVTPDSGAQRGGIRIDDRLTQVNGIPIKNFDDLRAELGKYLPDEEIKVTLERGLQTLELDVTLTEDSD